jgi:predicted metal-dependent hydrolase
LIDWLRRFPFQRTPAAQPSVRLGDVALPVVIRRNPRAKRMILRLGTDGGDIRVTMPPWGQEAEALAFARSRAGWLATQLATLPPPANPLADGSICYRGRATAVAWNPALPRRAVLSGDTLEVGGPEDTLSRRLQRWLEGEAERLMTADLAEYCARAALPAPPLRLSRARRRWGSCAADGTIRINWRLVQAPDPVRRSVVAHEVAHLVHFDHSPAFHACLAGLYEGDLAEADRWLKREGRSLYRHWG